MTFWIRLSVFQKAILLLFHSSHMVFTCFPPWKNHRFAWRQKKSFLKEMNWNHVHPIGDCLKKFHLMSFFVDFHFFGEAAIANFTGHGPVCGQIESSDSGALWTHCGAIGVMIFVALKAYRWLSTKCCWYSFCFSMFLSKVLKPVGPYCILKVKICWKSCKSQTSIQLCWDYPWDQKSYESQVSKIWCSIASANWKASSKTNFEIKWMTILSIPAATVKLQFYWL